MASKKKAHLVWNVENISRLAPAERCDVAGITVKGESMQIKEFIYAT
jgi:hypothetical protein